MVGAFLVVLALPWLREFFALDLPRPAVAAMALALAATADVALEAGWRVAGWVRHHHEVDEAVGAAPTRGQ